MSEGQPAWDGWREWRETDDISPKTNRKRENMQSENERGLSLIELQNQHQAFYLCVIDESL